MIFIIWGMIIALMLSLIHIYRVIQDRLFMSDFDKYMLELEENAKK